jgi:hypothetical protein
MPDFEGTDGTGGVVPPADNAWPGEVVDGTPNGVITMQMLDALNEITASLRRIEIHLQLITGAELATGPKTEVK